MDTLNMRCIAFLMACSCLLKVSVVSAFECPTVRNQLLIADPDDCRKYYHCLSGGRVFVKSCPKDLVFDPKQKVCVWDSTTSCLTATQQRDVENYVDNTIDHLPKTENQKPVVRTTKRVPRTRRTTTKRPTTTTRRPTTTTTRPTTTEESADLLSFDESIKIHENEMLNGGDYPDMAFDLNDSLETNSTEESNSTSLAFDNEEIQSGDSATKQISGQEDEALDNYSSFLFFPNSRIVKRAAGVRPATFAYKIACPNAFAYVVEPDNCDTFYHCNNWKPFLKRCPPGLHFDATNLVCNWPHNVNCFDGKRANTYFAFNQMRLQKFRKEPKMEGKETPEGERYKAKPSIHRKPLEKDSKISAKRTAKTTTKISITTERSTPKTTLKDLTTTTAPEVSTETLDHTAEKKPVRIFVQRNSQKKTSLKVTEKTTTPATTDAPTAKTTRMNRYKGHRNNKQDMFLFSTNNRHKSTQDTTFTEARSSVRPTLRSKVNPRYTMRYSNIYEDSPRMNPFTRPSFEKLEALRSKNIQLNKSKPSIILVDNTPTFADTYKTTVSKDAKDKYGKVNNTQKFRTSSFKPQTSPAVSFRTSTLDYTATSPTEDKTATSFKASSIKPDSTTTPPAKSTSTEKSTTDFTSTDTLATHVKAVQYANKPINMTKNMKIEQALSHLEPSKHIPNSVKTKTSTTESIEATDVSTTEDSKSVSFFTSTDKTTTDNSSVTNSTNQTSNSFLSTSTISTDFLATDNTTDATNVTTNATDSIEMINGTLSELNTTLDSGNGTLDFNETLSVNVTSFRANLEDLIDTYHANFDKVGTRSEDKDDDKKHSFDAGTNDTYEHQTEDDVPVSFTARTNTDRSAMMVQGEQGVKEEVQIEKFMIKMLNSAFNPKQNEHDDSDLTENDNMVDGDLNDTPTDTDRGFKQKSGKWVLFGNVDKKEPRKKDKSNKTSIRLTNTDTVEDTSDGESVIEEDLIAAKNQEMFIEDNNINSIDNVESSGDVDNFHNSIMIDNTDSETKMVEYISTDEEKHENLRNRNFFDAPLPTLPNSNGTQENDNDSKNAELNTVVQVNKKPDVATKTNVTETVVITIKKVNKDQTNDSTNHTSKAPKPESTTKTEVQTSTDSDSGSTENTKTSPDATTMGSTSSPIVESENKTLNSSSEDVVLTIEESVNGTELIMNDEAPVPVALKIVKIDKSTTEESLTTTGSAQSESTTESSESTTDGLESSVSTKDSSEATTVVPSDGGTNDTAKTVTVKTTANVTAAAVAKNATDTIQSKATMRSVKSVTGRDGTVSEVKLVDDKTVFSGDTPEDGKKSFISLSDLIKWYLRHWKNYSQWKGKVEEGIPTKAS
ncbi:mucin-2 [Patella vulgata]|uniref:mucin-2 n=1 Tax=Patella vulgata TaxID=6465 RepID=UPI0021807EFF|nr:mucin-2 [Patella vulgata]